MKSRSPYDTRKIEGELYPRRRERTESNWLLSKDDLRRSPSCADVHAINILLIHLLPIALQLFSCYERFAAYYHDSYCSRGCSLL